WSKEVSPLFSRPGRARLSIQAFQCASTVSRGPFGAEPRTLSTLCEGPLHRNGTRAWRCSHQSRGVVSRGVRLGPGDLGELLSQRLEGRDIELTIEVAAMVMARTISIHPERVGTPAADALRVAEAGPPGGTPVPVTCEVVFVIWPGIVACMRMGTLQDWPAPSVTLLSDQPLPLKTALPALHV